MLNARVWLLVGLFASLNFMDYGNTPDPFRDGKIRYLMLTLVPGSFCFFRKRLTFGPAYFAALALFGFTVRDFMLFSTMPIILIFAVMGAAVACVELGKDTFARLLVAGGVFQAALALLQVCGIHILTGAPVIPEALHKPFGLWGHETVLGPFLVSCLAAALWRERWVSSLLILVAILSTVSTMTYAALGAVLALFIWHRSSFFYAFLACLLGAIALGVGFLIAPDHPVLSVNGRGVIWKYVWEALKAKPVWGYGPGAWAAKIMPTYYKQYAVELRTLPLNMHMDYLEFLVAYGVVGAVPMAAAGGLFLRNFRPTWTHAVCVGLLVNALGNFPFCLPPLALIFVVCWAHSMRRDILDGNKMGDLWSQ